LREPDPQSPIMQAVLKIAGQARNDDRALDCFVPRNDVSCSVMSTGAQRRGDISCVGKQMPPLRCAPVDATEQDRTFSSL
jgi:hypothetical protein